MKSVPENESVAEMGSVADLEDLEERLSRPTPRLVESLGGLDGDVAVLGAGGKMGPTLARMARRACDAAKVKRRIIAVSRFGSQAARSRLESCGVETISGDLLDESFVASLPEVRNIVFMAGMKFGATGNESLTWAMNTRVPANVARRYPRSRIAALSTGNVYGLAPLSGGGSVETDVPGPIGEYAMSCLGRERSFEHDSRTRGTEISLLRLNYACELRYGVLVDLAQKVWQRQTVDLSMGMFNVIWQGDASAMVLMSLTCAASPPTVLNIAGPEQLSVQRVCETLGRLLDRAPIFSGQPQPGAILSNAQKAQKLFGDPTVPAATLIEWIADWVKRGGEVLGKPTRFEVRDGKF
jgi:uncharacterized protein YbjT (DUF2867 family)